MATQVPKSSRAIAVTILNKADLKKHNVKDVLNKYLEQTDQKQQATDLVFGTIRNRSIIDRVITEFADCPVERVEAGVLNIIRVGVYELIFSPTTAEYAIVDEAVKIAKPGGGNKRTGFVNAVLRQIIRHIQKRQIALSDADPRKTIPQTVSMGCEFDTVFLPEQESSAAEYFSSVFSLPEWLVADWMNEYGIEKVRQICFASNRRPVICIRPNTLKTTAEQITEEFARAAIDFEYSADQTILKLKSPAAVEKLPGFAEGLFSVQDITSSQAVKLLKPQQNWTILDLCAAPGTKTTQLAEATSDNAKIIATDIDSKRFEKVKENIIRLGIKSVRVVEYNKLGDIIAETGLFDAVLLDVPCSNTGVLARRVEARYRITPRTIAELVKIQTELLEKAAEIVKQRGKICYSTCSIQRDENDGLIRKFLKERNDYKIELEELTLPSDDYDGGYVAIITRQFQV